MRATCPAQFILLDLICFNHIWQWVQNMKLLIVQLYFQKKKLLFS
jgi:hypothetical protein